MRQNTEKPNLTEDQRKKLPQAFEDDLTSAKSRPWHRLAQVFEALFSLRERVSMALKTLQFGLGVA